MKTRLFNLLTWLSLVLCVATAALWRRSHWRMDQINWGASWPKVAVPNGTVQWSLISDAGTLCFQRHVTHTSSKVVVRLQAPQGIAYQTAAAESGHIPHGFAWRKGSVWSPGFYSDSYLEVAVPWSVVLVLVMTLGLIFRRGASGHPPGMCRICGYDLRATPERCPECGAVPKLVKQA